MTSDNDDNLTSVSRQQPKSQTGSTLSKSEKCSIAQSENWAKRKKNQEVMLMGALALSKIEDHCDFTENPARMRSKVIDTMLRFFRLADSTVWDELRQHEEVASSIQVYADEMILEEKQEFENKLKRVNAKMDKQEQDLTVQSELIKKLQHDLVDKDEEISNKAQIIKTQEQDLTNKDVNKKYKKKYKSMTREKKLVEEELCNVKSQNNDLLKVRTKLRDKYNALKRDYIQLDKNYDNRCGFEPDNTPLDYDSDYIHTDEESPRPRPSRYQKNRRIPLTISDSEDSSDED